VLPYATQADLASYLPADGSVQVPTGPEADRLLQRASELVAEAVTSGYAVTTTGAPSDATVAGALRDATCAAVEQWLEVGEENDIAGYPRTASMSSAGMTITDLPQLLAPRARRILRSAGLTGAVAW
jgi:hypothetical protein